MSKNHSYIIHKVPYYDSFDLNHIRKRLIHKDSCRDRVFCFSHGGKGLVVWTGNARDL
jgi:hypothetical protein